MKILVVTTMFPQPDRPGYGAFVKHQTDALENAGHQVEVLVIQGYKSKLNYIKAAMQVFYKTWKYSYDVVHGHYGLSGIAAVFRWKTPLVMTLHGSDALTGKLQPLISKIVCSFADAVIVVSRNIASVIPGQIIPCGVDFQQFKQHDRNAARARLNLPTDGRIILFPFDPRRKVKRFDLAESAVERLVSHGHNVQLLVAHSQNNEEMPWYYSAADAMILCSDSEGSPTSVKECLACNTPVVCTRVGDIEDIADGVPGVILCDQDVNSLAAGIELILDQLSDERNDSRSAMKRYDQRFLIESVIRVYDEAITKSIRAQNNDSTS